jgi:hypothetical protein
MLRFLIIVVKLPSRAMKSISFMIFYHIAKMDISVGVLARLWYRRKMRADLPNCSISRYCSSSTRLALSAVV